MRIGPLEFFITTAGVRIFFHQRIAKYFYKVHRLWPRVPDKRFVNTTLVLGSKPKL